MNQDLFLSQIAALKRTETTNLAAIEAIQQWVLNAEPVQRQRINPFAIAQTSHLGRGVIVPQLLYTVQLGLFDLNWDVHCPHCDMVAGQHNTRTEATSVYYCQMCEKQFVGDFADRIEEAYTMLIFAPVVERTIMVSSSLEEI